MQDLSINSVDHKPKLFFYLDINIGILILESKSLPEFLLSEREREI